MLNPIAKSLLRKSGISLSATIVKAVCARWLWPVTRLFLPTPASNSNCWEFLGADTRQVIFYGGWVSLFNPWFHFTFFVQKWVTKIPLKPVLVATDKEIKKEGPSKIISALVPILVPLRWINYRPSIANLSTNHWEKVAWIKLFSFSGTRDCSFDWGNLSFTLRKKFDRKLLSASGWGWRGKFYSQRQ